jgi:hypothetical protein
MISSDHCHGAATRYVVSDNTQLGAFVGCVNIGSRILLPIRRAALPSR